MFDELSDSNPDENLFTNFPDGHPLAFLNKYNPTMGETMGDRTPEEWATIIDEVDKAIVKLDRIVDEEWEAASGLIELTAFIMARQMAIHLGEEYYAKGDDQFGSFFNVIAHGLKLVTNHVALIGARRAALEMRFLLAKKVEGKDNGEGEPESESD